MPQNVKDNDNLTAYFGSIENFSQQIQQLAELAKIDLSQLEIDHLAVRMNDQETAEQWRGLLYSQSHLLKMSQVNGRPIYLFELNQPITFLHQSVSLIELPFPKGKIYPTQGWEHIEAVFPMNEGETVAHWIERTLTHFDLMANDKIELKISQPQVAGERLPNPSIAISAKAIKGYCFKLHPFSLKKIVESET